MISRHHSHKVEKWNHKTRLREQADGVSPMAPERDDSFSGNRWYSTLIGFERLMGPGIQEIVYPLYTWSVNLLFGRWNIRIIYNNYM